MSRVGLNRAAADGPPERGRTRFDQGGKARSFVTPPTVDNIHSTVYDAVKVIHSGG